MSKAIENNTNTELTLEEMIALMDAPKTPTTSPTSSAPVFKTTAPKPCTIKPLGFLQQMDEKRGLILLDSAPAIVYAIEVTDDTGTVITRPYDQTEGGVLCKATEYELFTLYIALCEHMKKNFLAVTGYCRPEKNVGKTFISVKDMLRLMQSPTFTSTTGMLYTKTMDTTKPDSLQSVHIDVNTVWSRKKAAEKILSQIK